MPYVAPNTAIRLYNVPWNSNYENTPYWVTKSIQEEGINSYIIKSITQHSYQRKSRNVIRTVLTNSEVLSVNYLSFRNINYESKFYYAFIDRIEYIGESPTTGSHTVDIYYTIDVLQTYFFDYELQQCFVEREIPQVDVLGYNILDENLSLGEYVYNSYAPVSWVRGSVAFDTSVLGCMIAVVNTEASGTYNTYGSIYSAAKLYFFPQDDYSQIPAFLAQYESDPSQIIAVYMVPFTAVTFSPDTHVVSNVVSSYTATATGDLVSPGNTSLDGYVPKNKKLYTYPYNYYTVGNASGSELKIRYEFCYGNVPRLMLKSSILPPVKLTAYPQQYKGCESYPTESISLDGFPQCMVATDAFNAWFAQNSVPLALSAGTSALGSLVAGNVAGAVMTGVSAITTFLGGAWRASLQGDITNGSLNSGSVLSAYNENQFYAGRVSINAEAAEVIDNYFSMYGYACRKMKVPNIHVRPHWTYTKTVGCQITGNVPADDEKKICEIFDKGIRFWNSHSEIGDYSLDNSPV